MPDSIWASQPFLVVFGIRHVWDGSLLRRGSDLEVWEATAIGGAGLSVWMQYPLDPQNTTVSV